MTYNVFGGTLNLTQSNLWQTHTYIADGGLRFWDLTHRS